MFEKLADGIWEYDEPLKLAGILIGHRMTVIRLPGGGLWVHSPADLTPEIRQWIEATGDVAHVVAPNCVHDLYLEEYRKAYPEAVFHGAPGLAKLCPNVEFNSVIGGQMPEDCRDVFTQQRIGGMPRINEIVYLHIPSRTLIVTDLVFNILHRDRLFDRFVFRINGNAYGRLAPSGLFRLVIKDKEAFRRSIRKILTWDFERIIMGHGEVVHGNGREKLEMAIDSTVGL